MFNVMCQPIYTYVRRVTTAVLVAIYNPVQWLISSDAVAQFQAFPFDPKTDWTHFYATGQDIHEYMKMTARKWNLDRDVKLNHRVTETVWQEDLGQWKLTVVQKNADGTGHTFVEYADFLISAQGVLR